MAAPWRSIADTAECYKIFLVLSQYNNHHITKETARKQLAEIPFVKEDLKKSIQEEIHRIMTSEESPKEISRSKSRRKNSHKEEV